MMSSHVALKRPPVLARRPSSSSSSRSSSSWDWSSFGVLNKERRKTTRNTAKKKNWAQKSMIPKNEKFKVIRFKNVLITLGVQMADAETESESVEQALIFSGVLSQLGCSSGCLGALSQYVCGPYMAYCGATIVATEKLIAKMIRASITDAIRRA